MNDLPTHCPECGAPVSMATTDACVEIRDATDDHEGTLCALPVCPFCGVCLGDCTAAACPHAPDA